jgi:hypothetical protein
MNRIFRMFLGLLLNSFFKFAASTDRDVFNSNGETNFPSGEVELLVNGHPKQKASVAGRTLGEIIRNTSRMYGIKTFTVYADGRKVSLDDSSLTSVCTAKQIDLVAKDARGSDFDANSIWTVDGDDQTE